MYRGVRQVGFLPVLQSFGQSPLEKWELKVGNGYARRVTDEQVRALALELSSPNVSTCYIRCPRHPRASLGIYLNYLVMIIKGMNKYFTFEITVLDDRNVHRRFRLSNFEKRIRVQHFSTSLPLCLKSGWNEIRFDLSEFTRKAYKSNYIETTRIQIHANCRIRVIYFCDMIYDDVDVPKKFKMFLPVDHAARKKSEAEVPVVVQEKEVESIVYADYEDEYGAEEEEEEGGDLYFDDEALKLAEASPKEGRSKAPSIEGRGSMIITMGEGDEDAMGGYYDDADYRDDDTVPVTVDDKVERPEEEEEQVVGEKSEEEAQEGAEENGEGGGGDAEKAVEGEENNDEAAGAEEA